MIRWLRQRWCWRFHDVALDTTGLPAHTWGWRCLTCGTRIGTSTLPPQAFRSRLEGSRLRHRLVNPRVLRFKTRKRA